MASNLLIPQFDSTPLFKSQNETNQNNYVTFIFAQGTSITYDIQILKDIGPTHYSKVSFLLAQDSTIKIRLPNYIGPDELRNFICMVKNGIFIKSQSFSNDFVSSIQTSEFFQNDQLTILIINDLALKTIDIKTSFGYINLAYEKILYHKNKKIEINNAWNYLFFSSLNLISNNLIGILKNNELALKINELDKRLREEVISRVIHLYYNAETQFEDSEDMMLFINFISNSRLKTNFFEILSHEYLFLLSEAMNDKSWRGEYIPAFYINILKNGQDLYEEYEIEYSIHKLVIVLEYSKSNDVLTMRLKLKNDKDKRNENMKIVALISQAVIDNKSMKPILNTISSDKTMITIFYINDLSKKYNISNNNTIRNQVYHLRNLLPLKATLESNGVIQLVNGLNSQLFHDDYLQISLRLKICYVYSFLSSFLLDNFGLFFGDNKLSQLTHNLISALIRNIGDQTHSSNKVLLLLNWSMLFLI